MDGQRCPSLETAPRSVEGAAAWSLARQGGVWRVSMAGFVGFDLAEARLRLDPRAGADPDMVMHLLAAMEPGVSRGTAARREKGEK